MKKFAFRLERVQSIRHLEVRVARVALAHAVEHLTRCDGRMASIDAMVEECRRQEGDSSPSAALARGLLRGLDRARGRAVAARNSAEQQVAAARGIWLQRRSSAAAVDKLHDTRFESWRAAVAAAEQSELEESVRLTKSAARGRGGLLANAGEAPRSDARGGDR